MNKEYDFSKAERGRFYRKGAISFFQSIWKRSYRIKLKTWANRTGREVGDLVNRIIEKEVQLLDELESLKET